jgi:TrmH family RNA methyltransferase
MIESPQNRLVKDIRRLKRRKGDHLLLEGPHLVREALATGLKLDWVLATPGFLAGGERELLGELGAPPIEIAPRILDQLTDADSPRGLLALAHLARDGAEQLPVVEGGVYLYLAGLQDPGNLGAVARVAEATGVAGLALSPECVHPNHPRALRASAGSLLRLPVAVDTGPEALDRRLAALGPGWVALEPCGGESLWESALTRPLVIAVGAERGLDPEVARRCGRRLTIPVAAPVESLNASVATALVLFEIRRRAASALG